MEFSLHRVMVLRTGVRLFERCIFGNCELGVLALTAAYFPTEWEVVGGWSGSCPRLLERGLRSLVTPFGSCVRSPFPLVCFRFAFVTLVWWLFVVW